MLPEREAGLHAALRSITLVVEGRGLAPPLKLTWLEPM